ncbi:hypothetical protein DCC62_17720 [candidate division KSB1 bacterium]|nr:MAG: hypothetical protein DCC62_17720 [candidate division KSB1 bacterium]
MLPKDEKSKSATIGGTFDTLHRGHKEYIRKAFDKATYVFIYITSDDLAQKQKNYHVRSRELRIKNLQAFLRGIGIEQDRYETREINALEQLKNELANVEVDISIIAPDYLELFDGINHKRKEKGKKSISVVIKERTRDAKNGDLSSTAIRFPYDVFHSLPVETANKIKEGGVKNLHISELIYVW